MVRDGFVAPLVGMNDASAMKRLVRPCARQVAIHYSSGRVIAHNTSAAGMAEIKLNIVRKKNHAAVFKALCQQLSEVSDPITQLIFDRIFDANAIGFVGVDDNPILGIWQVLNDAYEDCSRAEHLDGRCSWDPQQGSNDPKPSRGTAIEKAIEMH